MIALHLVRKRSYIHSYLQLDCFWCLSFVRCEVYCVDKFIRFFFFRQSHALFYLSECLHFIIIQESTSCVVFSSSMQRETKRHQINHGTDLKFSNKNISTRLLLVNITNENFFCF